MLPATLRSEDRMDGHGRFGEHRHHALGGSATFCERPSQQPRGPRPIHRLPARAQGRPTRRPERHGLVRHRGQAHLLADDGVLAHLDRGKSGCVHAVDE
jgi:hypothetical protein